MRAAAVRCGVLRSRGRSPAGGTRARARNGADGGSRASSLSARAVTGTLKGYDQLLNLVIEDAVETLRDLVDGSLTKSTRKLGTTVCRGTSVMVVSLSDGLQEVSNPFGE